MALSLASCKKKASEGYVAGGELVVIQDYTDINLGIYGIDTLNPIATKSESVKKIMNIIYEPLFSLDETGKIDPVLAYSYSTSNGGTQIEITLKSGVTWHDGTNFTAEDVAFTLSKMRDADGLYGKISSKIDNFTAVDKDTVIINFVDPECSPEYLLTFPIIPHHLAYTSDAEFVPVGTGGYKFISKSGTDIVLEPNTRWHEGDISERNINVKILKDKNAVADAFNVGEIDSITSEEFDNSTITPKANSHSKTVVSDKMVFLGFNTQSPMVVSQSVRKAINGSLDRKKIVEQDVYGNGVEAELSINPQSWISKKIEEKPVNYSEDIMEQDGYGIKDGIYHKDGIKLTLRLLVNEDNAQRTALAESIATSLKTAGFEVVLEKTTFEEYTQKIANDDFDMFIGEIEVGGNLNPAAMLSGVDNYFNFDTTMITSSMEQIYSTTSETALKSQIDNFYNLFHSDPPYLPLYFKTSNVIYGSYVSGVEAPTSFDPYKGIERWYFYDKDGKESKE